MTQKEKADQQVSPKNQTPPNETSDSSFWSHMLASLINVLVDNLNTRSYQLLQQTYSVKAKD